MTSLERDLVSILFLSKRSEKGKKRKTSNSAVKQENDKHTPCILEFLSAVRNYFTETLYFNLRVLKEMQGAATNRGIGKDDTRLDGWREFTPWSPPATTS